MAEWNFKSPSDGSGEKENQQERRTGSSSSGDSFLGFKPPQATSGKAKAETKANAPQAEVKVDAQAQPTVMQTSKHMEGDPKAETTVDASQSSTCSQTLQGVIPSTSTNLQRQKDTRTPEEIRQNQKDRRKRNKKERKLGTSLGKLNLDDNQTQKGKEQDNPTDKRPRANLTPDSTEKESTKRVRVEGDNSPDTSASGTIAYAEALQTTSLQVTTYSGETPTATDEDDITMALLEASMDPACSHSRIQSMYMAHNCLKVILDGQTANWAKKCINSMRKEGEEEPRFEALAPGDLPRMEKYIIRVKKKFAPDKTKLLRLLEVGNKCRGLDIKKLHVKASWPSNNEEGSDREEHMSYLIYTEPSVKKVLIKEKFCLFCGIGKVTFVPYTSKGSKEAKADDSTQL